MGAVAAIKGSALHQPPSQRFRALRGCGRVAAHPFDETREFE
jgi:hypothetical protein